MGRGCGGMSENTEIFDMATEKDAVYFVHFELDGTPYALPLAHVEQALRMVALIRVPETPSWIAGMMNLHGRVVPVVDLRHRFGLPPRPPHRNDRLLVLRTDGHRAAIIVDRADRVMAVHHGQIEAPEGLLLQCRPLQSVIRTGDDVVWVLDTAQLAAAADAMPGS